MSYRPPVRVRVKSILMTALAGAMYIPTTIAATPQVAVTPLLKSTHSWDGVQYRA